jgi:hypothetical protein
MVEREPKRSDWALLGATGVRQGCRDHRHAVDERPEIHHCDPAGDALVSLTKTSD